MLSKWILFTQSIVYSILLSFKYLLSLNVKNASNVVVLMHNSELIMKKLCWCRVMLTTQLNYWYDIFVGIVLVSSTDRSSISTNLIEIETLRNVFSHLKMKFLSLKWFKVNPKQIPGYWMPFCSWLIAKRAEIWLPIEIPITSNNHFLSNAKKMFTSNDLMSQPTRNCRWAYKNVFIFSHHCFFPLSLTLFLSLSIYLSLSFDVSVESLTQTAFKLLESI